MPPRAIRFKVPEDYGGVHEVFFSENGVPLAQGGLEVGQTFEMHPTEGPVGTPIEIRVTGLGWRTLESTWVVNWDNSLAGFVSAAHSDAVIDETLAAARERIAAGQIDVIVDHHQRALREVVAGQPQGVRVVPLLGLVVVHEGDPDAVLLLEARRTLLDRAREARAQSIELLRQVMAAGWARA